MSAGLTVGFFEWLRNDGPSNISQLFVNATTTPSASVVGANWTIKDSSGTPVPGRSGSCPATTPLVCSFGALNATQTVYLTAAFTIPANLADGNVVSVTFDWNTSGIPPGKNQSHGDATRTLDSVLVASNGDANGDFNFSDTASLTVFDDPKLSGKNRQSTFGFVASTFVGAYVADGSKVDQTFQCDASLLPQPTSFDCNSLTSEWSQVEVGNGKEFKNTAGGPGIKVIITFSQLPKGLSGTPPTVYHYWTTLDIVSGQQVTTPHAELITVQCSDPDLPTNATSCLIVNNKQVTVWLFHNGQMKG